MFHFYGRGGFKNEDYLVLWCNSILGKLSQQDSYNKLFFISKNFFQTSSRKKGGRLIIGPVELVCRKNKVPDNNSRRDKKTKKKRSNSPQAFVLSKQTTVTLTSS